MGEIAISTELEQPPAAEAPAAIPAGAPGGRRRAVGFALGAFVFVALLLLPPPVGLDPSAWHVAAVALLLAIFWLTEAIPLAATALLPLALFPILGIAPIDAAAAPYANPLVFLFLGGFLIALAIERWNLHRRIALMVLSRVGAREDRQIGGFMIATAALSMWVSNTATAVMMLPVALSIIPRDEQGRVGGENRSFAAALLLAVAYGASIGGISTLIGTPPNALLAGFMLENYGVQIGFAEWMVLALPLSIVMLVLCWLLLTRVLFPVGRHELPEARASIRRALRDLGPASRAEKRVALVFALTASIWILRPVLSSRFPGLQLSDTSIAMAGALVLFMIPSGLAKGEFLLTWEYAERLPWGVLLLFGGGLTLAAAVQDTGLAAWIGAQLSGLGGWPAVALVLAVTALIIFLTELTSNLATAATFLPVVAALAVSLQRNPLELAVPAVLAASFAFMMPVATPPNAIVFGSGHITIPQMVRAGIYLNLVGIAAILLTDYLLIGVVFGV